MGQVSQAFGLEQEALLERFMDKILTHCTEEEAAEAVATANALVESTAEALQMFLPLIGSKDPIINSMAALIEHHRAITIRPEEALARYDQVSDVKTLLGHMEVPEQLMKMLRVLLRCYVTTTLASVATGHCQPTSERYVEILRSLLD